jgi:hypothetical protein
MNDDITQSIRASYDRLADEYARRIFNELEHKPLDRELLNRFAAEVVGRGASAHHVGEKIPSRQRAVLGAPSATPRAKRLDSS